MKAFIIFCVLIMSSISLFPQGLSKKEIRRQADSTAFKNLTEWIGSRNFVFTATQVIPQSSPSRMLTTQEYTVVVKEDSVFCDLPFFGRAFSIAPGETGGFHFAEPIADYTIEVNMRRHKIEMNLKTKTRSDYFNLHFTIYSKKSASLSVISNNRSGISFRGELEDIEQR
jgi:hypothetical protein